MATQDQEDQPRVDGQPVSEGRPTAMVERAIAHSPLPWRHRNLLIETVDGNTVGNCTRWYGPRPAPFEAEANAEFIVRACNSHDELLAALKGLLADIEEYQRINHLGGYDNHWQVAARAAIAKAEAK